jgi:hypothetical protein
MTKEEFREWFQKRNYYKLPENVIDEIYQTSKDFLSFKNPRIEEIRKAVKQEYKVKKKLNNFDIRDIE